VGASARNDAMTDDDRDQETLPWQGPSILTWLLLAVNLWGFAILGTVLLAMSLVSFFLPEGPIQLNGEPVKTIEQKLLVTGLSLFATAVGSLIVFKKSRRCMERWFAQPGHWLIFWCVCFLLFWLGALGHGRHVKSQLEAVTACSITIRTVDDVTGDPIPVGVGWGRISTVVLPRCVTTIVRAINEMETVWLGTEPKPLEVHSPGYESKTVLAPVAFGEDITVRLRPLRKVTLAPQPATR
jgi:hypothetical protein